MCLNDTYLFTTLIIHKSHFFKWGFTTNFIQFTVVKALGYKPEGLGFETRRGEILNLPNPSGGTRSWGLLSL
jgi:hypothetical protein